MSKGNKIDALVIR